MRSLMLEITTLPGGLTPDNPVGQHTNGPQLHWIRVGGGEWMLLGRLTSAQRHEMSAAVELLLGLVQSIKAQNTGTGDTP